MLKRPACIFGCKVLTLPSNISGKFVTDDTSLTSIFAFLSSEYVPPVDIISIPFLLPRLIVKILH